SSSPLSIYSLSSSHPTSHIVPPNLHSFPTRRSSDLTFQSSYKFTVLKWNWSTHWAWKVHRELSRFINKNNDTKVKYSDLAKKTEDRKSTRLNSSHVSISYAVFCLKKTISSRTDARPN